MPGSGFAGTTRAPSSGRGSARIAHHTTRHKYTIGIFRTTSMKIASQAAGLMSEECKRTFLETDRPACALILEGSW